MTRRQFLRVPIAAAAALTARAADNAKIELPTRQVHLDFHTSELIPDVGVDFDEVQFFTTLKDARVNSINVFAKCHHGYAYYDTAIAVRHPSLKIDLLGAMVHGAKASGINVNYYYSLVWDVLQSRLHPEWLVIGKDGKHIGGPPTDAWPWLCMNTPYLDHVIRENREIVSKYAVDGAFFDILKMPETGCYCRWCIEDRAKLGLGEGDMFRHNKIIAARVEKALFGLVHGSVFFNSRSVIGMRDELEYFTHLEIESLPTGGWGYTHFQHRVRYMRTLGKDCVGMTGRFHKSWGDFGEYKNPAALEYEGLNFVANGVKSCVGDQLHPRGRLDPVTYRRIGAVYKKLESLEKWTQDCRAVADIGVIATAATNPEMAASKVPVVDQGFTNMLLELHQQFDVLDLDSDFALYKLIIVPDEIRPSPRLLTRLEEFVNRGGALIVTGESLLAGGRFSTGLMGVTYEGPAKFAGEYMALKQEPFGDLAETTYFLYQKGLSIKAVPGTEVLATYGHPYFDRSPEHFMSHKQTPIDRITDEPLITKKDRVAYIANPFFRSYARDGYGIQKQVVGALIRMLMPRPSVIAPNLPSTAQITMLEQRTLGNPRRIVHILYYPLTRRAPDIDIIEEPGLLENVQLSVSLPQHPLGVVLIPSERPLEFKHNEFYTTFTVPRVYGHQAIAFE
ncbi:MAG TPA: alpha-amylase family protein [Bryobacteraceae bacterium]|jgi:hypothetical protein